MPRAGTRALPTTSTAPWTAKSTTAFYDALVAAEAAESKEWEKLDYFEGCLPIEVLATRGRDTLRFGPMKPVGLRDPRTGKMSWAVVQLRKENLRADSYNLVGFQNHLKFGEQARVLRLIPGLENARFLRYGQIHRNTYICAPALLDETLRLRTAPALLFAGQICGVEGYTESIATGLLAGIYAASLARGDEPVPVPRGTALGSLVHYITHADAKNFQPANITFDLLEPLEEETRARSATRRSGIARSASGRWRRSMRGRRPYRVCRHFLFEVEIRRIWNSGDAMSTCFRCFPANRFLPCGRRPARHLGLA